MSELSALDEKFLDAVGKHPLNAVFPRLGAKVYCQAKHGPRDPVLGVGCGKCGGFGYVAEWIKACEKCGRLALFRPLVGTTMYAGKRLVSFDGLTIYCTGFDHGRTFYECEFCK